MAEGPAMKGTASGTRKGSPWTGRSVGPSGWGNTIFSAMRKRITPPAMPSEVSVRCMRRNTVWPKRAKNSRMAKANSTSRMMIRWRRAGSTWRSSPMKTGMLPRGSVTSTSRMMAEAKEEESTGLFQLELEGQPGVDALGIVQGGQQVQLVPEAVHQAVHGARLRQLAGLATQVLQELLEGVRLALRPHDLVVIPGLDPRSRMLHCRLESPELVHQAQLHGLVTGPHAALGDLVDRLLLHLPAVGHLGHELLVDAIHQALDAGQLQVVLGAGQGHGVGQLGRLHAVPGDAVLVGQLLHVGQQAEDADGTGDGAGFREDAVAIGADPVAARGRQVAHGHHEGLH